MSNMSYCRFENTYNDLLDCAGALEQRDELSSSEKEYRERMLHICADMLEQIGIEVDAQELKLAIKQLNEES